jgi:transcriptional regulator with XRE-family HTH domain
MPHRKDNRLGAYLKDRRTKLDPAALGFSMSRRRTPGLRREEVAQRAAVSPTWYTWLEQGRGGAPSADVLDRIARAMLLTDVEREHLFLLGLGRPPDARYKATEGISPRIQRILDSLEFIPAFIKTSTWDLLAWNRAAAAVFRYDALAPDQRNILRRIFCDPASRAAQIHWESVARFAVAAFRADVTRAGAADAVASLVNELSVLSPEFRAMWRDNDVRGYGEGTKQLRHPVAGMLELEYSAFAIVGRFDLSLVIYNPAKKNDAAKIRKLLKSPAKSAKSKPARRLRRALLPHAR